MHNPFTFNPITPAKFAGRAKELAEIAGMLAQSPPQNISIVGARRIGKTSLLRYLASAEARERYSGILDKYTIIYLNCQGLVPSHTPANFWCLGEITDDKLQTELSSVNIEIENLSQRLREWKKEGYEPIILLLDEFELMIEHHNFIASFFGNLRAVLLSSLQMLSLITATSIPLSSTGSLAEQAGSPLFNIFANVPLGKLDKDSTIDLVNKMLEDTEVDFSPDDCELVYALSWGHPFLAQIAGKLIVDGKNIERLQGAELSDWVQREFMSSNSEAYQLTKYLFSKLSPREQEMVKKARRNPQQLSAWERGMLRDLDRRGALPIGVKY